VPEDELDVSRGAVDHLRDEGLVETVDLGDDERGLVLTKETRDLLDSHTMERDGEAPQASHPPRVGAAACESERADDGAVAPIKVIQQKLVIDPLLNRAMRSCACPCVP
jgi:hypothetical protein